MPVIIAAVATAVDLLLLVVARLGVHPAPSAYFAMAVTAAMCVAAAMLRARHRLFLASAIAFGLLFLFLVYLRSQTHDGTVAGAGGPPDPSATRPDAVPSDVGHVGFPPCSRCRRSPWAWSSCWSTLSSPGTTRCPTSWDGCWSASASTRSDT